MSFKYYDLLGKIVVGSVLLTLVLWYENVENIPSYFSVAFLPIALVVGYFIDTIGAWLEGIYYRLMGGKPSREIFRKKVGTNYSGWGRVKFYKIDEINTILTEDSEDEKFGTAMRIAYATLNSRSITFLEQYNFSRSMTTLFVVIQVYFACKIISNELLCNKSFDNEELLFIIAFVCTIVLFYRMKERAYFYVKEVLNDVLRPQQNNKK